MFTAINCLISRFVEATGWSGFIFKVFTRILPIPTARVRGVPIRVVLPLNQVGVFTAFKQWETREPETLDWIDAFEPESVFFDIGASFGNETLYAALKPNGPRKIVCFDLDLASSYNLAYNLQINKINNVEQYYLALAACSGWITASEHTNYACVPARPTYDKIAYKTWSMSLDEFVERTGDIPDYIKIDVDGTEAQVVQGIRSTSRREQLKSLLIEVNAETREAVTSMLDEAGFAVQNEAVSNAPTTNIIFRRSGVRGRV